MIEVSELTKRYAGATAIDRLTFSVGRGEVVGFLGPNGAGKSTTMRILSCFMPATSGTAKIAGFDVFHEPDEVRRRIGYMPENNPLHLDMRVRDYLKFRARLKGLTTQRSRERVDVVMHQCGLTDVSRKVVGTLSKGFRQRVGLADALVHEPELIILDEPTIGLDPHQIRSVRELIQKLAKHHTILLSTHILSEVEMTCSRVLILHQGRIRASDSTANLHRMVGHGGGRVEAQIKAPEKSLRRAMESIEGVQECSLSEMDDGYWQCFLSPDSESDLRPMVFDKVKEKGWALRELSRFRYSLEDIFVHITRRENEEEES